MNKLVLFLILLLCISFVNAAPPITSEFVGDNSLIIQANSFTYYTSDPRWNNLHIYNSSNGIVLTQYNANITCDVEVVNSQGFLIATINATAVADHYALNGSGSLSVGTYGYVINCQEHNLNLGGFIQGEIRVTNNGLSDEILEGGAMPIFIFTMFIALLFLCVPFITKFSKVIWLNDLISRACYSIGVYFLMFNTGVIHTISDLTNFGLRQEINFLMWFLGLAGWLFILYLAFKTLTDTLLLWKQLVTDKKMGKR